MVDIIEKSPLIMLSEKKLQYSQKKKKDSASSMEIGHDAMVHSELSS